MVLRSDGDVALENFWEDWSLLPKTHVIRRNHACRLCVTVFARPFDPDPIATGSGGPHSGQSHETSDPSSSRQILTEEPETARHQADVASSEQAPAFRSLSSDDRHWLMKVHRNLGHPGNEKVESALREQGMPVELVVAAKELRCSACEEIQRPKLARPAALKPHLDFNDRVALDELVYTTQTGLKFHIMHMVDYSSSFHVAFWVPGVSSHEVIDGIARHWMSWAGAPRELIVDSATELTSDAFLAFAQSAGIRCTTIAPRAKYVWQGRAPRPDPRDHA